MSFFAELKRRNVFRVAAAYAVVAWLLIEVSDTVFPRLGLPEWTVTLVIALLLLGFPVALFFAWAYELTPEGLKREKDVDRSASITPHTGKKLDRAIMVVLALALAFFAFDKFVLDPQRDEALKATLSADIAAAVEEAREAGRTEAVPTAEDTRSIAVLAFDDMSPDKDQEYLSDGIAEELLNLLAKIPELRVISRSSAFSFKGKDLEIPEIAERLNVAHILEGSVRKAGNRIRITAQLIDARSDTHLWSETYDRTLDDVFAIQDDIAATVVEQLKVKLLGEAPRVEETDPEAYALFLQARHLSRLGTAKGYEQSNALFQQVLAIDPNYPAALDGLAVNYVNMAAFGLLPRNEGYAKAREVTGKALAIDPDHAPANSRLGWIAMSYDNDLAQAARHFERSLQLDPANPDMIGNAAVLLSALGRVDEAIAWSERVTARDPMNPTSHANLGFAYHSAGRWDDAIASLETALRLSPDRLFAHYGIGVALLMKREPEAALESFASEGDESLRVTGQALALYTLGRQDEYQARRDELIERWGDEWPFHVADVYAWTGDADLAFEWLDRAVIQHHVSLAELPLKPFYQPLHADPRWREFLERVGGTPEQMEAIKFEVALPAE
jgi:TolB-like protein/Tfp pilus assembly protein PilF